MNSHSCALTHKHRNTHSLHSLPLSCSLRLHCAITMVTADWVTFHCTDCSIVISVLFSSSVCLFLFFCPLPTLPCSLRALIHCHCVLPTILHKHTHTHTHTHKDVHNMSTVQFFILILTVHLLPLQALLSQLVVWHPNSSCPAWLCHCGSWECVCSLWLVWPPLAKVGVMVWMQCHFGLFFLAAFGKMDPKLTSYKRCHCDVDFKYKKKRNASQQG